MLVKEQNVEKVMADLEVQLKGLEEHLAMLERLSNTDEWELGLFEGRIGATKYILKALTEALTDKG